MNKRHKGRRRELQTRDILEQAGYDVQLAPLPSRWSKQNDLFGLFDIIAVNNLTIRFIQVKSNRMPNEAYLERIREWTCPTNCTKEVWVFNDGAKQPVIKVL